jgi:hypothetical protein
MPVCCIFFAALLALSAQDPGATRPDLPAPTTVLSPPDKTSVKIAGARITVKYSSPSMRKWTIFGGLVPYGKVWRAGANDATALHTDFGLDLGGLRVPKGDYTLFVLPTPDKWLLIVNKQTGQTGLQYDEGRDLGRVPMTLSTIRKPLERYRMTLPKTGESAGELRLEWKNTVAAIQFSVEVARGL